MYTILDYIKYYKNASLKEVPWNTMDNLICAFIAYLPSKDFKESYNLYDVLKNTIDFSVDTKSQMMKGLIEISKELIDCKRYQGMKIANFINRKDNDTQFGAVTLTMDNLKIISFKGTDNSIIGWHENFRLWYLYPSYTQKLAINYVKDNVSVLDNNVYIVGHSKGGNLAEVAALELNPLYIPKLRGIYSFDGPGLKPNEFNSLKYKAIKNKLNLYIPSGSAIGCLMYNKTPYVVKTNTMGINEHYPINWLIFGEFFVKGTQNKMSKELHNSSLKAFDELDPVKLEKTVDGMFNPLVKNNDGSLKIDFKELMTVYSSMKNIDPNIRKYINQVFGGLLGSLIPNSKKGDEHGQKN